MHPVPTTSQPAVRLRAAAADVAAIGRELSQAAHDVGARGAAGAALQHLVRDVAGQVQGLGAACLRAAAAEQAAERAAAEHGA